MDYLQPIILYTSTFILFDRSVEYFLNYKDQTTYYLVHFIFNLYVTFAYFPCFIAILTNIPYLNTISAIPISLKVASFQIYHCIVYYKFLRKDDWVHHILAWFMVYTILLNDYHGYSCVSYFFMTGICGLGYYGPLFMLKNKWISKKTEITIQYYVNVYLRAPSINFSIWAIVMCYVTGHFIVPNDQLLYCLLNIIISIWNAQYFTMLTTVAYINFMNKL